MRSDFTATSQLGAHVFMAVSSSPSNFDSMYAMSNPLGPPPTIKTGTFRFLTTELSSFLGVD